MLSLPLTTNRVKIDHIVHLTMAYKKQRVILSVRMPLSQLIYLFGQWNLALENHEKNERKGKKYSRKGDQRPVTTLDK